MSVRYESGPTTFVLLERVANRGCGQTRFVDLLAFAEIETIIINHLRYRVVLDQYTICQFDITICSEIICLNK